MEEGDLLRPLLEIVGKAERGRKTLSSQDELVTRVKLDLYVCIGLTP